MLEADMTSVATVDVKKTGRLFRPASIAEDATVTDVDQMSIQSSPRYGSGNGRLSSADSMMSAPLKFSLVDNAGSVGGCNGIDSTVSSAATTAAAHMTTTDGHATTRETGLGAAIGAKLGRNGLQSPPSAESSSPSAAATIGSLFSPTSVRFASNGHMDDPSPPSFLYRRFMSTFDDPGQHVLGHRQQSQQSRGGNVAASHYNSSAAGLSTSMYSQIVQPYMSLGDGPLAVGMSDYPSTADPSPFSTAAAAAAAAAMAAARQSQHFHKPQSYTESMFYRHPHGDTSATSASGGGNGSLTTSPSIDSAQGAAVNGYRPTGSSPSLTNETTPANDHRIHSIRGYLSSSTSPSATVTYIDQSMSSPSSSSMSDAVSGGRHYGQVSTTQLPFDSSSSSPPTVSCSSSIFDAASSNGALVGPLNSYLYHNRHHYIHHHYGTGSHPTQHNDYQQHHQRYGSSSVTTGSFSGHDVAVASALLARSLPVFR